MFFLIIINYYKISSCVRGTLKTNAPFQMISIFNCHRPYAMPQWIRGKMHVLSNDSSYMFIGHVTNANVHILYSRYLFIILSGLNLFYLVLTNSVNVCRMTMIPLEVLKLSETNTVFSTYLCVHTRNNSLRMPHGFFEFNF